MSDLPERIGPYVVEERLARGPLGLLYRARHGSTGARVALKVMPAKLAADQEAVERFLAGAGAIAAIDHPNVARIVDHGRDGDQVYYAVPFSSEIPLGQLLKQRRLSLPEAFTVFKGVALGLAAAHRQGILHRDLHPANVLVSSDLSTIRLTDFGLSSAAEEVSADSTATSMSTKALHYLAPEQIGTDAEPDQRSDIYSLGVLFYEMLLGRVPIGQFNLPSRVNPDLPAELDPVVLKCLEREPSARYASVDSLLADTERLENRLRLKLVSELKGIGRTFSRPTSHIVKHRRAVGATALALGVVAALALGALYWLSRERRAPTPILAAEPYQPEEELPPLGVDEIGPPPAPESGPDSEAGPASEPPRESTGRGARPASPGRPETPSRTTETAAGEADPGGSAGGTETAAAGSSAAPPAARMLAAAQASAANGQLDEALLEIRRLIDAHPGSNAATEALFLRATIQEMRKRFDEAMTTYTEIGTRERDPELRAKARYRFGRAALDSGLPDRNILALGAFDEVPRAFPETEYAPLALAAKAAIEEAEKTEFESAEFGREVPAAFLTSLRIVEEYPDSPAAEKAFWLVGTQLEDLKLWERAADAYWQLGTRFPQTRLEAWWKAGQVFDRRLDDAERALEAYRRVPASSPHAEDARKRIARLSR
jgi:serine/threonine protein kinase/outer membrane protein assembly factor BamD (BamD/ComL family)